VENSKIIIGDVHGCFDSLMELRKKLPHDNLVFVGDLVDRGPKSRQVVEFVKDGGYDCVRGNHEEFMITGEMMWTHPQNGGRDTLDSYEGHEELFKEHVEWMRGLPTILEYPYLVDDNENHLVVTHSFVSQCWDIRGKRQFDQDVMWGRAWSRWEPIEGVYNCFGHTPVEKAVEKNQSVNLDSGCVFGYDLTAMEFPSKKIFTQKCVDDSKFIQK
jgi:serine/threonine protein phosphatase 1